MPIPVSSFKPDFSAQNPYAGVTADYTALVASKYVPTTANPLSPVQTAALSGQLPASIATSSAVQTLTPAQQALTGGAKTIAQVAPSGQVVSTTNTPTFGGSPPVFYTGVGKPPPIDTTVKPSTGTILGSGAKGIYVQDTSGISVINGVKLTGNLNTDMDALIKSGASEADIASYIQQNKNFNWGNLTETEYNYISKSINTFNANIANYIQIGQLIISKDDFNKLSSTQQFTMMQNAGIVPADAKLSINKDGTWGYTLPSSVIYDTSNAPTLTKNTLDYLRQNNPDVYSTIQQSGNVVAWGKYADKIVNAMNATQTTQTGLVGVGQPNYDGWSKQLPQTLQNIYNTSGGGLPGYNAVKSAQQQATNALSQYSTSINVESGSYIATHGGQVGKLTTYDIVGALRNGVDRNTLLTAGITSDAIKASQSIIDAQNKLAPYGDLKEGGWAVPNLNVNTLIPTQTVQSLARFQRDNPNDNVTLNTAGYSPLVIKAVKEYNNNITNSVSEINGILTGSKSMSGQLQALTDAISNTVGLKPQGLGGTEQERAKVQWDSLTQDQQNQVALAYSQDVWKGNYLSELYKQESEVAQQYGTLGQVALGIPMTIEQPYAEKAVGLPTTVMQWLLSGATTATIALPFIAPMVEGLGIVGNIGLKGVEAGTMGIFGTNIVQNWNKMDTGQKILNVGMLVAIPIGEKVLEAGKTFAKTGSIFTQPEGIPPAGLKTGGLDVAFIEVPDHFFKGLPEEQLKNIYLDSSLTGAEKIIKIADLMTPETREAFLDFTSLAQELSKYKVPESQWNTPEVTFKSVEGMNEKAAIELAQWARNNPDAIFVGSVADKAQGFNLIPGDFDIDIPNGSKERVAQVKTEVQDIISRNGATAEVDAHTQGAFGVLPYDWERIAPSPINNDGVKFLAMGKQVLNLTQVITAPAIGETAGLMSPEVFEIGGETLPKDAFQPEVKVGTHAGTLDKILRTETEFQQIIDDIRTTDPSKADLLQPKLDSYVNYINEMKKGNLQPIDVADALRLKQQFLNMVGNADQVVLTQGKEAIVYDPESGGTLTRRVVPATEILPNTIYSVTRDYTPFLDAQRAGEKITVGTMYGIKDGQLVIPEDMTSLRQVYKTPDGITILNKTDISGAKILLDANKMPIVNENGFVNIMMPDGTNLWISKGEADSITRTISSGIDAGKYIAVTFGTQDAPRQQMFFSLEVAFDRLRDPITGELMPKAGIIALRTTPSDTAIGSESIGRPFRYEYDSKGNPIVYSEKVIQLGETINPTKPTGLSTSGVGVSDGLTGETLTYDPRTKTNIPMLWFATDSASELGLGAPTVAQMNAIKWLAFKSMITDLVHPHINTDIKFSWGESGSGSKGSLITFDRDTYTWRDGGIKSANDIVNGETAKLNNEAVSNLTSKGLLAGKSPEDVQTLIDNETNRLQQERVQEVLKNQEVMKQLTKESGKNIYDSYTINLSKLLSNVVPELMLGSIASTTVGKVGASTSGQMVSQGIGGTQEMIPSVRGVTTSELPSKTTISVTDKATSIKELGTVSEPVSVKGIGTTDETLTTGVITTAKLTTIPPTTIPPTTIPPTTPTTIPPTTIPPTTIIPPPITIIPPPTNRIPIGGILKTGQSKSEKRREEFAGSLIWQQGFGFWAIKAPYSRKQDIAFFRIPPEGAIKMEGAGAAYKTIQQLTGKPPSKELQIPLGVVTIKIKSPQYKAGASGAISYKMNKAAKKGKATGAVRIVS